MPDSFNDVGTLLNNAGNAQGLSTIQYGDSDDCDTKLYSREKALINVSKAIIPKVSQ